MGSRVAGSLIAVCLLIAGLIYMNIQKGDERVQLHDEVLAQLETLPDYAMYGSLYNQWLDENHDACFDANYSIGRHGGRYGRYESTFDSDLYLDELFDAMIHAATAAGYTDQAEQLRGLRGELSITEEDG